MAENIKFKICGLTRAEDVDAALNIGADFLGFILYPKSKRYISPPVLRELLKRIPSGVAKIGVFVNAPPGEVVNIIDYCGLDIAQLHGEERPADAIAIGKYRVWKAVNFSTYDQIEDMLAYPAAAFVADAGVSGNVEGGSGRTCSWDIAAAASKCLRLILAGGISPANAAEAVRKVRPYALDVNSGVESAPGIKDHTKLMELGEALKNLKDME